MILRQFLLIVFLISSLLISSEVVQEPESLKDRKDSKLAWKLSIVPGLGQIYNEKYLKGFFFFSSEAALLRNISLYSADIAMRNSLMWLVVGLYVFNIIDAYVDAELNTFSNKDKE